ncbi:MAG: hypothetical protein Q4E59_01695 [Bacteroidales bacterium]|nr:hypothetical protein [Bacteroidales bacterium]
MKVTIVSPEKTLFTGEATCVAVPGKKGRFEVLSNHAPIMSTLSAGTVECKGAEPLSIEIDGGFIEVARNEVSVCVEVRHSEANA